MNTVEAHERQDAAASDAETPGFLRIYAHVDVRELNCEIRAQPALWGVGKMRQQRIPVQRETSNICLRSARRASSSVSIDDIHESGNTRLAREFPATMRWVEAFASQRGRQLGRALLARLRPRGQVYSHIDHGDYYRIRDRYHLVLVSACGSPMTCGKQTQVMREGELWWFDNKQVHAAFNPSDEDRIHLIFDLSIY
jgi:Aspartyl/Asparaginyl beta-hydroxylase